MSISTTPSAALSGHEAAQTMLPSSSPQVSNPMASHMSRSSSAATRVRTLSAQHTSRKITFVLTISVTHIRTLSHSAPLPTPHPNRCHNLNPDSPTSHLRGRVAPRSHAQLAQLAPCVSASPSRSVYGTVTSQKQHVLGDDSGGGLERGVAQRQVSSRSSSYGRGRASQGARAADCRTFSRRTF